MESKKKKKDKREREDAEKAEREQEKERQREKKSAKYKCSPKVCIHVRGNKGGITCKHIPSEGEAGETEIEKE